MTHHHHQVKKKKEEKDNNNNNNEYKYVCINPISELLIITFLITHS